MAEGGELADEVSSLADSLASAAASSGGVDTEYGASGWGSDTVRLLFGAPDANGDDIPDIWALRTDGTLRFHAGSRTALRFCPADQ